MKVVQLLPTISYGDAVGNDTLAIKKIIEDMGYETQIYAENIDERLPKGTAKYVSEMPEFAANDVIIYHASTGTELNYKLPELGGRKVMMYHNITPPSFFHEYSPVSEELSSFGIRGIQHLADKIDYAIADSEFNKEELLRMGYTCQIDVCPILIPFSDYETNPAAKVIQKYSNDGYTNLLFVGRIAPNKKQENVIRAFYFYRKYFNSKSRLFLVGSWSGMDKYYERLCDYVKALGISDSVVFTGHIKFNEILAYYQIADAFVCMSEHEGFCVPLIESMYFKVPIVAYDYAAIPYTLGGSGVLLDSNDPVRFAKAIERVISDAAYREDILSRQAARLQEFSYENVSRALVRLLTKFQNNET